MGAMTKAELEAMVKRLQKSLDRAEAKNLTLINSLKRANAKNKSLGKSVVEGRAREKATSEILGVISQSPTDVAPVFETIMKSAVRLCGSPLAGILRFDGGLLHVAATHNWPSEERLYSRFPCAPNSSIVSGRAILAKSVVHISDALVDPHYDKTIAAIGHWRRILGVPLMRGETPVGVLVVGWPDPGETPESQVELLKTFADQAVIAIENARLFNETKRALEQQTAVSEILSVISSSPTDVQPVYDAIVRSAVTLCGATLATVYRLEAGLVHLVGIQNEHPDAPRVAAAYPAPVSSSLMSCRAVRENAVIQVPDIEAESGLSPEGLALARLSGFRSVLSIPLRREGLAIGAILVGRPIVGVFPDEHVVLLKTFADQAVIAIENVRLFNETKEALEQQKVISEILHAISSSPTDTQPVFDAIVNSGVELFGGTAMTLRLIQGEHTVTVAGSMPLSDDIGGDFPVPLADMSSAPSRAIAHRKVTQIEDLFDAASPLDRKRAQLRGFRAVMCAPLLRDGKAIGTLNVMRATPGMFTDKQTALLQTFASQAVIAIENARLFKELQAKNAELSEALEQQIASGEILNAISHSTADIAPVFDTIIRNAVRLGNAAHGFFISYDGSIMSLVAHYNVDPRMASVYRPAFPRPPARDSWSGRAVLDRAVINIPEISSSDYSNGSKERARQVGIRSVLVVPMLRGGAPIGVLVIGRHEPGAFADSYIALLQTFADQAVIAIENVRLFNEIQEKNRQLEVASQHKSQFLASMSHELRTPLNAILGFNEMMLDGLYGEISEDLKDPLQETQTSGRHLLRLINNVLDLAKIEAGRMELALADYAVQDMVESVRATLRPLAEAKGLQFNVTVASDIPLACGDAGRLTQCLMNLAGNSLKFTKAGQVAISVAATGDILAFHVVDTGIGIAPEKIDSLFTEFKQTDATIASEYGGTGLGLAITRQFIEMHGGRIWVESELGKGSTFIFEIPLRAQAT